MTLPPPIYSVVAAAARLYCCSPLDVTGKSQMSYAVAARRKSAQDLRAMGFSFPEIGRWLGLRSHATIMNLCRTKTKGGKVWAETRLARRATLHRILESDPLDEWSNLP